MPSLLEALGVLAQAGGGFAQGVDRREQQRIAREERERVLKLQEEREQREKTNQMLGRALQRQQIDMQALQEKRAEERFNVQMAFQQQDREATAAALKSQQDLDRQFRKAQLKAGVITDLIQAQERGRIAVMGNLQSVIAYKTLIEQNPEFRDKDIDAALNIGGGVIDVGDAGLMQQLGETIGVDFTGPSVTEEDGRVLDATMRTAGVTPETQIQGPLSLPFTGVPAESTDALSTQQTPPTGPFPLPGAGLVQGIGQGLFGIRGPERENFFRRQATAAPSLTPGLPPNSAFQLFPVVPTP